MAKTGVFKPGYLDKKTGTRKKSDVWWISYRDASGKRRRESSHSKRQAAAVALRAQRLTECGRWMVNPPGPRTA